jgi:hypothetical protein
MYKLWALENYSQVSLIFNPLLLVIDRFYIPPTYSYYTDLGRAQHTLIIEVTTPFLSSLFPSLILSLYFCYYGTRL